MLYFLTVRLWLCPCDRYVHHAVESLKCMHCVRFFKVERLKMEVAKQANQQQKKVKERAAEAKRIQDLERQVHTHSAEVYLVSS